MALCLLNLFMFMYTVHYSIYSTYILYIYQVRDMALCLLSLFMFMYTVLYTTLYTVHIYYIYTR